MRVAVVIPALNAQSTLAQTVASLRAQSLRDFEAVIVDDGSSDATHELALRAAREDARIRVVQREHGGLSAARNTGIAATTAPWLHFLDADDLIVPEHLQRLLAALDADPGLDLVYGDWARLSPGGEQSRETCRSEQGDLFALLAQHSAFPVHSCVVRRSALLSAGGFDPSLPSCEDWDLWQRIARGGGRFGHVPGVIALYRMRADSLAVDPLAMLRGGLRVIATGHAADPRVHRPLAAHARGLAAHTRARTQIQFLCWCAGLALGRGEDPRALLAELPDPREPGVAPHVVAEAIFRAAVLPGCRLVREWPALWPSICAPLARFLQALEASSCAPGLARRTQIALERLVLSHSPEPRPIELGCSCAARVEIAAEIVDLQLGPTCERAHIEVSAAGAALGSIELPVCDGVLPAYVLRDAIAAELAWPILNRFFERTLYPALRVEHSPGGAALWRGAVLLAADLPSEPAALRSAAHLRADWTLFLQELWDRPQWPPARFYDAAFASQAQRPRSCPDGRITVEVGEDVPDLRGVQPAHARVTLAVAGCPIGSTSLPAHAGRVTAQQLIAALSAAGGLELCRAVVREALIGQRWDERLSLREQLRAAASRGVGSSGQHGKPIAVLPRRTAQIDGHSSSRRASLPLAALDALADAARAAGEPPPRLIPGADDPAADGAAALLLYTPECIPDCAEPNPAPAPRAVPPGLPHARLHDRDHFESLFARGADPWDYTSAYEQRKYEQTLALVEGSEIGDALEIGCAEGHFTRLLAPRVARLTAADISQIALARAAEHCRGLANVRFARLDLLRDALGGPFDLIVCSEVLYFAASLDELAGVARRLARALRAGGRLVTAHAHLVADDPDRPGFDWDLPFGARVIGDVIARRGGLRLVRELCAPLYRVQVFERPAPWSWPRTALRRPRRQVDPRTAPLPPRVASSVRWGGGKPARAEPAARPVRLPILAYHRIAAEGGAHTAQWRLAPQAFEEQLRYLRESGFHTPSLHDWRAAVRDQRPLPGHPVVLTFDDAYLDFYVHARPRLRHYGFHAWVFAVTDCVGKTNAWDAVYGEAVPLMDWSHLRELGSEGFSVGSHSATHTPLTALSPEQIVREAARSRAVLARELGGRVDAFAYPYGDTDAAVQHLIGACGYTFGLTTRCRAAAAADGLLALPRIDVQGTWSFAEFVGALHVSVG